MMKRYSILLIAAAGMMIVLAGCSKMTSTRESIPAQHPEELEEQVRADCLECHEDVSTGALKPYETFRHSIVFVRQHAQYAPQKQNLCAACHAPSFCQACHANKEELKPSLKLGDRPDRALYHRGDYIIQHRLEGRVNPASCSKCHARRNTKTCSACHN
jgi:hypothetical protein